MYFRIAPELSAVGINAPRGNENEFSAGIGHGLFFQSSEQTHPVAER